VLGVISADLDTKAIERQIVSMAGDFGESNESAICRWGVAVCRDLVKRTQAWGDDTKAKDKQIAAIKKDANKAVFVVDRKNYVNGVASGKLSGLVINGELVVFTPDRILKTPQEVIDFIDLNRTNRQGRVPTMKRNMKGITSRQVFDSAIRIKAKKAGQAKGGWVGAGKAIGAKQRKGSRITIGKDVAGYAHKFQTGGTATLQRDAWNPSGKITNNVPYVSTDYVLKKSDASNAINTGGRMTVKWYESAMAAKLKRKTR
jgi:hypothetical protein